MEIEATGSRRLLDVLASVAKEELGNEYWLRMVADLSGRSFEEMRVIVLEFLDTDGTLVFSIVGLAIYPLSASVERWTPWATIVIGVAWLSTTSRPP